MLFVLSLQMKNPLINISLVFAACLSLYGMTVTRAFAQGQQPQGKQQQQQQRPAPAAASEQRERGIKLYQQNDLRGAIKALREAVKKDKKDADAWYFLGLALSSDDKVKDARKAFEASIRLRPDYANAHVGLAYILLLNNKLNEAEREATTALNLDAGSAEGHLIIGTLSLYQNNNERAAQEAATALNLKPALAAAWLLQSQVMTKLYFSERSSVFEMDPEGKERHRQQIEKSVTSLEQYLKMSSLDYNERALWRNQLEDLRFYARLAEKAASSSERRVFAPREVTRKARILFRPEPQYTEAARKAGVEGTVVLRAVLDTDGLLKHIIVVSALSHGLTEQALRAAPHIKFEPAEKDGRPVPQFIQIEYNFSLY